MKTIFQNLLMILSLIVIYTVAFPICFILALFGCETARQFCYDVIDSFDDGVKKDV